MKLGVFTVLFSEMNLEEMLDHVKAKGIDTVEIGSGGFVGGCTLQTNRIISR